jgi:hypothetical protein
MSEIEMRDALPARFVVGRRGTPDPDGARYYVLDVVHDYQARAQLRGLVRAYRLYGSSVAADELEALLDATQEAHVQVVRARQERLRSTGARGKKAAR